MATHGEFALLISAATQAIARSLNDGDLAGYDAVWVDQTIIKHLAHAHDHIDNLAMLLTQDDPALRPRAAQELDHAIARLLMMRANWSKQEMLVSGALDS